MSAIKLAIEICGGASRLAEILRVTPGAVSQWANGTRPVPPTRCRAIEAATDGRVTCEELRPDVFGSVDSQVA